MLFYRPRADQFSPVTSRVKHLTRLTLALLVSFYALVPAFSQAQLL